VAAWDHIYRACNSRVGLNSGSRTGKKKEASEQLHSSLSSSMASMTSIPKDQAASGLEAALTPFWPLLFLIGVICSQIFRVDMTPYTPTWLGTQTQDPQLLLIQRIGTLSPHSAFRLGVICTKVKSGALSSADGLLILSSILFGGREDDRELGWEAMQKLNATEATVDALPDLIKSRWTGGMLAKLAGLLNFGSIILIIGGLGVSIALLPALWPVLLFIFKALGPLLLLIHQAMLPFYALFVYSFILYVILLADQFSKDVAPFVILVAGFLATATYAGFGQRFDVTLYHDKLSGLLFYAFIMIMFAFPAVRYQSSPLGFSTVVALFSLLGFVVIPIGCGWLIGWANPDAMSITVITAGTLTLILVLRKVVDQLSLQGIAPALSLFDYFFKPFGIGCSVFGSLTFCLAGLITSSKHYRWNIPYAQSNIIYLLVLLLYIGLGAILGDSSFRNCGATFLALYLSQKVFEAEIMSIWVGILLASGALVGSGFWLKAHPLFILSLVGATPKSD
jgi:hypothetical protein